jgi:hypothetical protein
VVYIVAEKAAAPVAPIVESVPTPAPAEYQVTSTAPAPPQYQALADRQQWALDAQRVWAAEQWRQEHCIGDVCH